MISKYQFLLNLMAMANLFQSCSMLKNRGQFEMDDGSYRTQIDYKKQACDVITENDTLKLKHKADVLLLPSKIAGDTAFRIQLNKPSFDIDLLTILVKIRPPQYNYLIPTQLSTNLNGNLYVGYRNDVYNIHYSNNHFGFSDRKIKHFGCSAGLFAGVGSTLIDSKTTNNKFHSDYTGMVLQNGIAGIIAIDNINIGISVGIDHLLDQYKTIWIYQNKPWFGLMLGLNLN